MRNIPKTRYIGKIEKLLKKNFFFGFTENNNVKEEDFRVKKSHLNGKGNFLFAKSLSKAYQKLIHKNNYVTQRNMYVMKIKVLLATLQMHILELIK